LAVLWAACFNFLAAFIVGTAVAKTFAKGLVDPGVVTPTLVCAGLLGAIICAGWIKPILGIVVSPLLGMILGMLLSVSLSWSLWRQDGRFMQWFFRKAQLVSAALYSLSHGSNDAQKTM